MKWALQPTCGQGCPGLPNTQPAEAIVRPETAILCSCMASQRLIQVWYLPQTVGVSLTVTIDTKREQRTQKMGLQVLLSPWVCKWISFVWDAMVCEETLKIHRQFMNFLEKDWRLISDHFLGEEKLNTHRYPPTLTKDAVRHTQRQTQLRHGENLKCLQDVSMLQNEKDFT